MARYVSVPEVVDRRACEDVAYQGGKTISGDQGYHAPTSPSVRPLCKEAQELEKYRGFRRRQTEVVDNNAGVKGLVTVSRWLLIKRASCQPLTSTHIVQVSTMRSVLPVHILPLKVRQSCRRI